MKKITCLLLVFTIAMINFFPCSAIAADYAHTSSAIVNEYDYLQNLSNSSDSMLSENGYSASDITLIRDLKESYVNHLNQYARLSTSALKNLGYSQKQISIFRNFSGSEDEIRALAATLNFSLSIDYVTWSSTSNRTNARLVYNFSWSGVPLIKTTDIVAVSWNDWTINGKSSYVTYSNINGTGNSYSLSATYVSNSGPSSYGGGYKFAMTQDDNNYWAQSGYGIFTLYHNYAMADLSAYAQYGHSTISVTPGFSIPGYGSISFTYGTSMAGEDWADLSCQS